MVQITVNLQVYVQLNHLTYSQSTPKSCFGFFEGMFSGNCPSPRVGEANVKDRGRGSIARKCLSARTEKINPKNDLGVTQLQKPSEFYHYSLWCLVFRFLTSNDLGANHSLVPPLDDLANAQFEFNWRTTLSRAIKFFAIFKGT